MTINIYRQPSEIDKCYNFIDGAKVRLEDGRTGTLISRSPWRETRSPLFVPPPLYDESSNILPEWFIRLDRCWWRRILNYSARFVFVPEHKLELVNDSR